MYRTKEYVERPWDEVKAEIDIAARHFPDARRIFLADGDALNMPNGRMVQILEYTKLKLPKLERVSCYAMPKNLLQKTRDELDELRLAGLDMLYVGIESGSDVILRKVTKGATHKSIVQACAKAKNCGYVLSCMVILGLGGRNYSEQHVSETARILNETNPDYVGALTLYLEDAIHEEFQHKFGEEFIPLNDIEVLDELEGLVTDFNPKSSVVFRANHASNVYSLGGKIPDDKEQILVLLRRLKNRPELLKPKFLRRF